MSFFATVESFRPDLYKPAESDGARIKALLAKDSLDSLDTTDFQALLSPAATDFLETMAQKANALTVRHFGRSVLLYTPIYLGNYCCNSCLYCGFNVNNRIPRYKLTLNQLEKEAELIAETGLKHVLILTGESREETPVSYLIDAVRLLRRFFSSVSIEVYPLTEGEYRSLVEEGVDGITVYQEVYDREVYNRLHPSGPKKDYRFRLDAPERAGNAGIRTINIGALFGLHEWRQEAFLLGLHAAYLQKKFSAAEISVSFPRFRPEIGGFTPRCYITDKDLVQMILAFRLFLPRVGITISTREKAELRDRLIPLGVTKMSAGSSTVVGGRLSKVKKSGSAQFEIADHRSVKEMAAVIYKAGYQPVYKDW